MFQKFSWVHVFFLLLLCPYYAIGQLASFSSTNPANLVVCGDPQSFTLKVTNTSLTDTLKKGKATVKLPTGFHYVISSVSSAKSVTEYNTSVTNAPVFSVPDINPKDSVKFSIKAYVDCSVIAYINSGGSIRNWMKLSYNSTYADSGYTSYYSVAVPSLSISKITNQVYTGTVGDTFSRYITITNTMNAPLKNFTFYLKKGTGINVKSLSQSYTTNADTLIVSLGATDFKKIGNGDSYFDQGEKIVIKESDSLIACTGLGNTYIAGWGCNGSTCQKYTTTSNVVLASKLPNLVVTSASGQSTCYTISTGNQQRIIITNIGSGPAVNTSIDIMQTSYIYSGFMNWFYSKIDISSIQIQYGSKGKYNYITPNSTTANYAYTCLGSNPKGEFLIKLPVIKAGDTITIVWDVYSCCIDQGYINAWGWQVKYGDQCGNGNYTNYGSGRDYWKNYQLFGTPVANTTDLLVNDTTWVYYQNNYLYSNLLPGLGNEYIQYQFSIPSSVKVNTKTIFWTDVSGNAMWKPDSVKLSGGVLYITFNLPPPSGFAYYGSRLYMQMAGDTSGGKAKCGDKATISFLIVHKPSQYCGCISTLSNSFSTFVLNCVNPDKVGLNNAKFTFYRTSYGKPDNNDDGVPDASGSLYFTKIRRDKAMYGDTITASFAGRVLTDSAYRSWKYGFVDMKFTDDYLSHLDITLTIKDSANNKTYTCTSVPYAKVGKGYSYFFGIDTLRSAGCTSIPSTFTFHKGDSVYFTIHYRVSKNTQDIHYITLDDDFYFSNKSQPTSLMDHFSINRKSAYYYSIGYYFTSCCSDNIISTGCNGLTFSESFYLSIGNCCSNYYGGNMFPYEYRNWANFTQMKVVIPKNFNFQSARMYYYPTQGTGKWGNYSAPVNLSAQSGDTLIFNVDSIYKPNGGPFQPSDDGYAGTMTFFCLPTCAAIASSSQPITYFEYYKQSDLLGGGISTPYKDYDYVTYTPPKFSLQAALPTISVQADTMSWTLYITNLSQSSPATKAWIGLQSISGKILIDTVFKGTKKITATNGIFKLDTLSANKTVKVKIKARMKNCVEDSIKVLYGWDCNNYPDSIAGAKCATQSITLYADPLIAGLQMKSTGAPDSIYLCDTAKYTLTVTNVQAGTATDVNLWVNLPPGTKIVKSSSKLRFPMKTSMVTVSDPDSINPYLYVYKLSKISSYVKAHGLPGYFDTTKSSYQVSFRVTTNCDYISGSNLSYTVSAYDVCGNVVSTTGLNENSLKIIGAKVPYSGLLYITGQTSLQGCGGTSNIRIKFVNNGPVATDSTDFIYLDLPNGMKYVSGTLKQVHNSPSDSTLTKTVLGTATRFGWQIPRNVKKGDSIVFTINYTSDSTLTCSSYAVPIQTTTTLKLKCIATNTICSIKVLTGINSKNFTITKPKISISGFTATSVPSAPLGEMVTVKATVTLSGDTLKANSHSVIKFYYDKDGDRKYSAGDILLSSDTVNTLIKPGGTYKENKTFFVPAGKACAIIMMWDTIKQNCACTPAQALANPVPFHDVNNDTTLCSGVTAKIGADSINGYKYSWSPSTGLSNTSAAHPFITLVNSGATSSTTTYKLFTTRGSCTTSDSFKITIYPALKVSAGSAQSICMRTSVSIGGSPTASGGSGVYSYKWTPSSGLSSTTVANPGASPATTTLYHLQVTDNKGCTAFDSVLVTVISIPAVSAGPDRIMCFKDSVSIGGSPSASGTISPYTYSWSPTTALSKSNISNPKASPSTTTAYILTVTDAKGCKNADTVNVTVNPLPKLNAGTNSPLCLGDSMVLGGSPTASGASAPYIYRWSAPTGLSDTISANPKASPKVNTTYTLKVMDANGCKSSATVSITVNSVPKASAGLTKRICNGASTTIGGSPTGSAGKSPYTYSWAPVTGLSSSTASNPTASPSTTTTYKITVSDANGCKGRDSVLINVNPLPVISAGTNDTICKGDTARLNGSSNVSKYYWSPGKYLADSTKLITKAYPPSTTTFTLTAIDSIGCTSISTKKIVVTPLPVVSAGGARTICFKDSIKIGGSPTASSGTGAYFYSWTPASGLTSTKIANPYAKSISTATYTVLVTDSRGCKAKDSAKITVLPLPVVSAGPDVTICRKDSILIGGAPSATGTGPFTYSWNSSSGLNNSLNANPKASPSATTSYILTVTDGKGCRNYDTMTVKVNPLPKVDAGPDGTICFKDSITIGGATVASGTTSPYSYSWSPGTGLNQTNISNPRAGPSITTSYIVSVTDGKGCKNADTMVVNVNPLPKLNPGKNRRICIGGNTTLGGTPTASGAKSPYSYSWSPSTGLSSTSSANPVAQPLATTTYKLLVKDANGCQSTDSVTVYVNPLPTVNAGADDTLCRGDSVKMKATSGFSYKYNWSPGKYLNDSTLLDPKASPAATTSFVITATDSIGCKNFDTAVIYVRPKTKLTPPILRCVNITNKNTIVLNWDTVAPNQEFFFYTIYRQSGSGIFTKVAKLSSRPINSWTDATVTRADSISYSYYITVTNHCMIEGAGSDTVHSIILTTTQTGDKTVKLNWNNFSSTGNTYSVLIDSGSGFKTFTTLTGTSYVIRSCKLSAAFKIAVKDVGCTSNSYPSPKISLDDTTAPKTNDIIIASTDNWSRIHIDFKPSDSTDTRQYFIYRGDSSGAYTLAGTIPHVNGKTSYTFIDNLLKANHTQYFYKIKSVDTCGNYSGYSTVHSPVLLKGKPGNLRSFLQWRNYIGFTADTVEVQKYIAGTWKVLGTVKNSDTAFTDSTNIGCNITYSYRIASHGGIGKLFSYSDTINVTPFDTIPPANVNILSATVLNNSTIQLNFNKVADIDVNRYDIYAEKNHSGFAKIATIFRPGTSPVSYLQNGINTQQDTFSYMVKAVDSCGNTSSVGSETHRAISLKGSPADYANHLRWSAYKGFTVSNYIVQQRSGGSWVNLSAALSLTDTVYTDTLITCNVTKYYRIKAVENGGDNAVAYSDSIALTPFDTIKPDAPKILAVSVLANGKVQLTWTKSAATDVRNYVIYKYTGTAYTAIDSVGDVNTWTDNAANTINTNCYKVQAVDSCARNRSAISPSHCTVALDVSNKGCEPANYLNWNDYLGWNTVSKYEVYRSVNGGPETLLATPGVVTYFKDTGLNYHDNYCYRIKAYEKSGSNISWSNQFCKKVFFVDTPLVVVATKLNSDDITGKIKVQWTSQKGKPHLAYYKLYYSTTGKSPYTLLKDSIPLQQDTFIHTGLNTKVGEHFYYLQTIDSCNILSEISSIHKTMDFTFRVGQLVHQLNWTPYKGWPVKYYIVQHAINTNPLVDEDTLKGTDTSMRKFPAPCNTRVVYRIKAVSFNGTVSYSDSMGGQAIDTIPSNAPTMLNLTVLSGSRVRIDFLGADSLDTYGYGIQRSKNGGSFATAGFINFTKAHAAHVFIDTVNTLNDQLCYQVITLDSCLNATPSQVFCAIQLTGKPQNLADSLKWYRFKGYGINKYEVLIYKDTAWQNLRDVNTDSLFRHDSLSCNVPRTYKIEGFGVNGYTTFSDSITLVPFDTTRPFPPVTNYVSVVSGASVLVNWQYSPSKKVKQYEVQYKSPNGAWTKYSVVTLQKTETVTGLNTHDSFYDFRIIAIDTCAGNRSFPSNTHRSILLSGKPQNLANKLSWTPYGGFTVDRYVIHKLVNGIWTRLDSVGGSTTTYTETGLSCNVPYYYKLLAYSSTGGWQSYSDSISVTPFDTTRPAAPVINYATVLGPNSILLNWNFSISKKVKQYEVQVKSPNSPWNVYSTVTLKNSLIITGLNTHDSAYDFRVIAIDTCAGNRSLYPPDHQTVLLGGTKGNLSNFLTWSAYKGFPVNRYIIYKYAANVWSKADSVSGTKTTYLDTGLSCNILRHYKVEAISANTPYTSFSDSIALMPFDTIKPPAPVIKYATVLNGSQIQLSWNKSIPKVKQYDLWIKSAKGSWTNPATVFNQYNYVFSGLKTLDSTYSFRIAVEDTCANNVSPFSKPHTVIQLDGDSGDLSNTLKWTSYKGFSASKYYIYNYRKGWQLIDSVNGTTNTYIHKNIPCNVPQQYRVAALDNTGQFLSYSDSIQLTPFDTIKPPAPLLYSASVLPNSTVQISWQWDKTTEDKTFEVWRSVNNGPMTKIGSVVYDSTFIDKTARPKKDKNAYYVIAIDSCSTANRSKPSRTDTLIIPSFKTGGCRAYMQLNWSPYFTLPGGTDAYEIYKSKNGAPFTYLATVTNAFTYTDFGVDSINHFSYMIKAISNTNPYFSYSDSFGIQPWQFPIPKKSYLVYTSVVKTDPANGQVMIQWKPYNFVKDTFAKGYRLYYSNEKNGPYNLILDTKDQTVTSFLLQGVNTTDSNIYAYLKVYNSCNLEGDSNIIHSPAKLKLINKDLEVDVTWKAYEGFSGVKSYNIYRSDNGSLYGLIASVNGGTLLFKDTTVACMHKYYYRIEVIPSDPTLAASYSDSASVTAFDTIPPAAAKIWFVSTNLTDKTNGTIDVVFKGNKKRNRAGYLVYYSTDGKNYSFGDSFKDIKTDTLTWEQPGLNTAGNPYSFVIRAYDSCGNISATSDTQSVVYLSVTAKSHQDALQWTGYKGWKRWKYVVQRRTPGTLWTPIMILDSTKQAFNDNFVKCDTFYIYRIVSIDQTGSLVSLSNLSGVTAFDTDKPAPPVIQYVTVNATGIKKGVIDLKWTKSASTDVAWYDVFRKNPKTGIWETIATKLFDSTYTDSNLNTWKQSYEYMIQAVDSCRNPNITNSTVHNSILLHAKPANQSVALSWNAYKGWQPLYYDVYRDGLRISRVPGTLTTYLDTPAMCPVMYLYMVEAIDRSDTNNVARSNVDSAAPYDNVAPKAPYLIRATVSQPNNAVTLEWTRSKDFDTKGYKVLRRIAPMNYFGEIYSTADPNDTTFTDLLNKISDSLCYVVVAYDHCNNISVHSNPGCVIIVQGEARSLANTLQWNPYLQWPGGVDHYNLYRKTNDTLGYLLLQQFTNPVFIYTDTGFIADSRHYCYRIEAIEKGGFNAHSWSTELCLVQPPMVWIPNVFTPQLSPGINDQFGPRGIFIARYEMDIYNRWGQRIYATTKSQPWDGSFAGDIQGEGVFLYHITVYGHDGKPYYFKGTVEILK
jgi:fibronectin type 3 domain-containing protein